jgi:hypothetical protein
MSLTHVGAERMIEETKLARIRRRIKEKEAGLASAKRRRINCGPEIKLMIHHQLPGIELVSPVYAGCHATCSIQPEQKVNVGSTMQAYFNADPNQDGSISILMCRLKRANIDKLDEDEATCIQLVVIWKIDRLERFHTFTYLIEHDEDRIWDRDMLIKLSRLFRLFDIQHCSVEETWLIHNNIVMKTSLNITHEEECYKLEMTVSETRMKDDTHRPCYFDMIR